MPSRNIHSLSLALLSSASSSPTFNRNSINSPRPTIAIPPFKVCSILPYPDQHHQSLVLPLANREFQHPSTIFRLGQITPTTPYYFPQGVSSPSSDGIQKEGIMSAAADGILGMGHLAVNMEKMDMNTPDSPSDDDFCFSLEEFEKRYVPLSHLPTPPMSAASPMDLQAEREAEEAAGGFVVEPEFWGPAKYLVSMVPRNASRESPSVMAMAAVLQHANVRLAVVSLACCVLDCLSDQFVRLWRRECCRADGTPELSEVLAVAALAVSMKFVEDASYTNNMWAHNICEDVFTAETLSHTERLMLADINYCLLSISSPELIEKRSDEIKRAMAEAAGFGRNPVQQQQQQFAESRTTFPLSGF